MVIIIIYRKYTPQYILLDKLNKPKYDYTDFKWASVRTHLIY